MLRFPAQILPMMRFSSCDNSNVCQWPKLVSIGGSCSEPFSCLHHAPIFREEACPAVLSSFELTMHDSDNESDSSNAPLSSGYPTLANSIPIPSPPPSTPAQTTAPPPPPSPPAHPVWERQAPCCLDPSEFGPHGHQREAIANAYEDRLNDVPMANLVTAGLEEFAEFIFDDAHLANTVITGDVNLPDAPTFCEAMSGPEHDKWHL